MLRQVIAVEASLVGVLQHPKTHVVIIGDAKSVTVNPVEDAKVYRMTPYKGLPAKSGYRSLLGRRSIRSVFLRSVKPLDNSPLTAQFVHLLLRKPAQGGENLIGVLAEQGRR